ncbi:MAG: zinc-ribbon domain-containing protein [Pseudomonadales bacterium]|nr:zinc-ribbon domain-containing protein [Pseudomonadales bacterium]
MTEQLLTKCPHCETTFRLSPAQLETAQGAVRCGACLQVFHASDFLVDQNDPTNTSETNPNKPFDTPGMDTGSLSTSDSTESQPFSFETSEEESEADIYGHSELNLKEESREEADEAWAEALLRELNEEDSAASFGQPAEDFSSQPTDSDDADSAKAINEEGLPHQDQAAAFDFSEALPESTQTQDEHQLQGDHHDGGRDDPSAQFAEKIKPESSIDETELSDTFKQLESFDKDSPYQNPFTDELISSQSVPTKLEGSDESWAQTMLTELEDEEHEIDHQSMALEEQKSEDPGLFGLGYQPEEASDEIKKEAKTGVRSKLDQVDDNFFATEDENDLLSGGDNNIADIDNNMADSDQDKSSLFTDSDLTPQIMAVGNSDDDDITDDITDDIANDFTNDNIPNLLTDHDENKPAGDYLSQFESDSFDVVLPSAQTRRSFIRPLAGVALNVVVLLLLATQFTVYNFDSLARQEKLRPQLQQICEILACALPSINDASQIKGANLVVRLHPTEVNALVIDAIIYNRSKFEQPFPILQLSFSDINGALIASRDFSPAEYRRGELLFIESMPSNTPIHLSLEILDPGAKAVNYQLKFHYPKPKTQS